MALQMLVLVFVTITSPEAIGPDKQNIFESNFYFLTHQFKHVFWCLKEPSQRDGYFGF